MITVFLKLKLSQYVINSRNINLVTFGKLQAFVFTKLRSNLFTFLKCFNVNNYLLELVASAVSLTPNFCHKMISLSAMLNLTL